MRELLSFILEGILGNKNFVVEEKEDNGTTILELKIDPEEVGLVIGKGGQTIKSIQNIVRVRARKDNKNVFVKVL